MTDTPVPDVRLDDLLATPAEMAIVAMHATFHDPDEGGWPGHNTIAEQCHDCQVAADAVLAAVTPVIRRQVAEEIGEAYLTKRDRLRGVERMRGSNRWEGRQSGLEEAANIARSLSAQPEGITE